MKRFISIICLFAVSIFASNENKPVKTIVLENFPPHYTLNKKGQPDGFAVDVIEAVAKRAGIELEYIIVPSWEASNKLFYEGNITAIVPEDSGITPGRLKKALFTSPVETFQIRAFKRASDDTLTSMETLDGRKVGVVQNNSSAAIMDYYDDNLTIVFPTKEEGIIALLSGQIDVFIYPAPVMEKLIEQSDLGNKITAFGKPLKEIKRGIRVSKNALELAQKLDNALQDFLKSPEYLAIYHKWHGEKESYWNTEKKIQAILLGVILLLAVYLLWYFLDMRRYKKDLRKAQEESKKIEIEKNILESMFQRHSAIMLLIDPKQAGKIIDANQSAAKYYGYSKEELISMSIEDINTLTKKEVEYEMQFAQQEQRNYFLFKHRLKSGEIRDVEVHSTPFKSGQQTLLFSVIHDITERNRAQQELMETKRFVSTVVEESPVGVFIVDENRIFKELNKSAHEMFGYQKEELINRPSSILYEDEATAKAFGEKHYVDIRAGKTVSIEHRIKHKNGQLLWCHMTGKAMDKNDLNKGIIWILQNIDLQKKQQAALQELNTQLESKILERTHELQEREKDLRLLVDNLPVMILYKDTHNNILDLNETTAAFFGKSVQDLKGKSLSEFTEKKFNSIAYQHDLDVIKSKKPKTGITYQYTINGEKKVGEAGKFPILDEKGEVSRITTIVVDVTDKIKIEEEKKQHEQIINQQSRHAALGEMIGAIAHQWRQPLTSLGGILINLQDSFEYGELDDKTLNTYVKDAEETLSYMSKTIDDFRNFFKPDKVKIEFDAIKETKSALELLSAQLKSNHISYSVTTPQTEDKPIMIYGYPNEFKQVILNIVNNAKDAIHNVHLKNGKVAIIIEEGSDTVTITVKDNGGEIPDKILKKVFDPYFTTKHESQGTGLGLYMSKTIIEKNMHGLLRAYNEDGWAVLEIKLKGAKHGKTEKH